MTKSHANISVVIPTYRREQVLIDTINYLLRLDPGPIEILVVDQTEDHGTNIIRALFQMDTNGSIQWVRLKQPSTTQAMNVGLLKARSGIVLFVDDDVIPHSDLISAHLKAYNEGKIGLVAGRVIQPWDVGKPEGIYDGISRWYSNKKKYVAEFIGCNFSVRKELAVKVGGFDENFIQVAYRYESEFSERVLTNGYHILFEPMATVTHLRLNDGGTRSYGEQLKSIKPCHSVGEYYYLIRSQFTNKKVLKLLWRPFRAIRTKHHLFHPWWIPVTLISELLGFAVAIFLVIRGPRYISQTQNKND
jgi:glycosyltransferase involved in cell wall biosynthesis